MKLNELVLFDAGEFPLVHVTSMPACLEEVERWIIEVEALLLIKREFVLVYPPLPPPEEEDLQARKRLVLWLKVHRQWLASLCRGMVLTATEQPGNLAQLTGLAPVLAAVYGVPVQAVPGAALAHNLALSLLTTGHRATTPIDT
ncbi:hypothetical protein EXN22_07975 [Pseudomonas tructae]|uniref:Uncharacterized protein n=1 Tax=Pseudomonas tructae TaxID=2518644 RepID=A0A411MFR3_9PSED|nr:hypothetical protein [Pseudomonas tructae]QBF25637.1 hypothetical protein EXN22_07975 [Pseudomonas tructae]